MLRDDSDAGVRNLALVQAERGRDGRSLERKRDTWTCGLPSEVGNGSFLDRPNLFQH